MSVNFEPEKIVIGNTEYPAKLAYLSQKDLRFYPKNPRVFNVLNCNDQEPSQEEIESHMKKLEHVKQLKASIESNGGLIDPLIVRDCDMVVLEGNSRLAAYRILNKINPVKWGLVRCQVLPSTIDEDAIFRLIGQYHIVGRKDWSPFEQANYLYRRHKETKLPAEEMGRELGITKKDVESMLNVIQFMVDNNDLQEDHWSYYEEYLKNAGLRKYRQTNEQIDARVVEMVQNKEITSAPEIRKLGKIAKCSDDVAKKTMNKMIDGELSVQEAYDTIDRSGALIDSVSVLEKFRKAINKSDFIKGFNSPEAIEQSEFEIVKIQQKLAELLEQIQSRK